MTSMFMDLAGEARQMYSGETRLKLRFQQPSQYKVFVLPGTILAVFDRSKPFSLKYIFKVTLPMPIGEEGKQELTLTVPDKSNFENFLHIKQTSFIVFNETILVSEAESKKLFDALMYHPSPYTRDLYALTANVVRSTIYCINDHFRLNVTSLQALYDVVYVLLGDVMMPDIFPVIRIKNMDALYGSTMPILQRMGDMSRQDATKIITVPTIGSHLLLYTLTIMEAIYHLTTPAERNHDDLVHFLKNILENELNPSDCFRLCLGVREDGIVFRLRKAFFYALVPLYVFSTLYKTRRDASVTIDMDPSKEIDLKKSIISQLTAACEVLRALKADYRRATIDSFITHGEIPEEKGLYQLWNSGLVDPLYPLSMIMKFSAFRSSRATAAYKEKIYEVTTLCVPFAQRTNKDVSNLAENVRTVLLKHLCEQKTEESKREPGTLLLLGKPGSGKTFSLVVMEQALSFHYGISTMLKSVEVNRCMDYNTHGASARYYGIYFDLEQCPDVNDDNLLERIIDKLRSDMGVLINPINALRKYNLHPVFLLDNYHTLPTAVDLSKSLSLLGRVVITCDTAYYEAKLTDKLHFLTPVLHTPRDSNATVSPATPHPLSTYCILPLRLGSASTLLLRLMRDQQELNMLNATTVLEFLTEEVSLQPSQYLPSVFYTAVQHLPDLLNQCPGLRNVLQQQSYNRSDVQPFVLMDAFDAFTNAIKRVCGEVDSLNTSTGSDDSCIATTVTGSTYPPSAALDQPPRYAPSDGRESEAEETKNENLHNLLSSISSELPASPTKSNSYRDIYTYVRPSRSPIGQSLSDDSDNST